MICKGYGKVNNKLLESYNTNKPALYIMYLDANTLLGHSMMQPLLTKILDWFNLKDFDLEIIQKNVK